jgi:hypothetical protein
MMALPKIDVASVVDLEAVSARPVVVVVRVKQLELVAESVLASKVARLPCTVVFRSVALLMCMPLKCLH